MGEVTTVTLDGEAAETQLKEDDAIPKPKKAARKAKILGQGADGRNMYTAQLTDDGAVPKPKRPARKAQVLGVGGDGRNQYTVDPDARAGHRSATNSRPAGPYVGYELHLAVQARDVRWTNGIDRVTLSDEVPGVITSFSLNPAGTHRGKAIVDDLIAAKQAGKAIEDVVWDPGYSLCKPGTVHHKLAQAGIHQTFQPVSHQRGIRPFPGDALLIDGQLFSSLLPDDLRDLPSPPWAQARPRRNATRPRSISGHAGG